MILCIFFISLLKRDYSPVEIIENTFRIYFVFAVLVILPLLILFCLYGGKVQGVPFYTNFFKLFALTWSERKATAISTLSAHIFLLFAGLSIPLSTIFYFCFGYKKFLHRYSRKEFTSEDPKEGKVVAKLKALFFRSLRHAGLTTKVRFLFLDRKIERDLPIFTECGVVGKARKDITLLISKNFVKLFEEGKLTEQEVKSVFFHEISHVYHRDHFLPLWAKNFISSHIFILAAFSCVLAFISGFFAQSFSLENFIIFLLIFPLPIFFRMGVLQIVAHAMREREYLADARAIYFYISSEMLIKTIKKSAILFPKANRIFPHSFFIHEDNSLDRSKTAESLRNFKEFLKYSKWLLYCFLTGTVYWHPPVHHRIKAIKEKRNIITEGTKGLLSPFSVLGSSFLLCLIELFILVSCSFLGMEKSKYAELGVSLSYTMALFLVFLSCLPLRLLNNRNLRKNIPPLFWKRFPLYFFIGRFWRGMHLNNLFISEFNTLFLVLGGVSISYFYILWLFLICTGASLLLIAIAYLTKSRDIINVDKNQKSNKLPLENL